MGWKADGPRVNQDARRRGALAGLVPALSLALLLLIGPISSTPQEVAVSVALVVGLAMTAGWLAGPLATGQQRRLLLAAIGYALALIAATVTLSIIQGASETWAAHGPDLVALVVTIAGRGLYCLAGTAYLLVPALALGLVWGTAARGLARLAGSCRA
jgi:hypothetical protein